MATEESNNSQLGNNRREKMSDNELDGIVGGGVFDDIWDAVKTGGKAIGQGVVGIFTGESWKTMAKGFSEVVESCKSALKS